MRVRFHLPDFAGKFRLNLMFAEMLRGCPEYFREGVEIASFYGVFPPSIWNGGRTQPGVCDKNFVRSAIKAFNERGIPLRFTFTNPALEKKHLSDEFCNMVMRLADNGLNEAIVNSPLLEDYIRTNYPNYKLTSSICKRLDDEGAEAAELEKDYHIVVLDYDFNNKFDILEKLPNKEKCEILVNTTCDPGCPRRKAHYKLIGEYMICYNEHLKNHPDEPFDIDQHPEVSENKLFNCKSMGKTAFQVRQMSNHISPDAIWNKYVPMGFNQFKIEGRTAGNMFLIETYMYYMAKPECRDEARLMFMYNLEKNGVIKIN